MRRSSALIGAVVCAGLGGALSGCVEIPDHGSVRTVDAVGEADNESDQEHTPAGPQKGAPKATIVDGWFEAMTAAPVSTTVAREFLLPGVDQAWTPDGSFLVYDIKGFAEGVGPLKVGLFRVSSFDSQGRWLREQSNREIAFDLDVDGSGQWRIQAIRDVGSQEPEARDSVIVPSPYFKRQFEPLSLYFYSGSNHTLVPEPVYLPRGDQRPTLLVRALLAGPIDDRVEHTYAPDGVRLSSVTVDSNGVAEIPLSGLSPETPPQTVQRMAAQFAWTLQQIPEVKEIRISVDGDSLLLPNGRASFPVENAYDLDPAGMNTAVTIFGLRDGLAVRVIDGFEQALTGAFGTRNYGLRDISVSIDGEQMAGVTRAGDRIQMAGVTAPDRTPAPAPRTVFTGGADLMHPAWDLAGRMWVVDRRPSGAQVWVLRAGGPQRVTVPAVSGEQVTDFLVSRDGTRFVASVRSAEGDRVVVNRIVAGGGAVRATESRPVLSYDRGSGQTIRDIAWRSPTSVYYVTATNNQSAELHSAILDGAPPGFDPLAAYTPLDAADLRVVSSPRPDEPVYLQRAEEFDALATGDPSVPRGLVAVTYVG